MDFSFSSIMAGFIYGVFGVYLLKRGKSEAHVPHILIGLGLLLYTFFVTNVWLVWGIGALGLLLAYWLRD